MAFSVQAQPPGFAEWSEALDRHDSYDAIRRGSGATAASLPNAPHGSKRLHISRGQHTPERRLSSGAGAWPIPAAAKERALGGARCPGSILPQTGV